MSWKFKPIEDARKNVLYAKTGTLKERIANYNEHLRENVGWELYVAYLVHTFDVYVDAQMIVTVTQHVYGDSLDVYMILSCAEKNMSKQQMLI